MANHPTTPAHVGGAGCTLTPVIPAIHIFPGVVAVALIVELGGVFCLPALLGPVNSSLRLALLAVLLVLRASGPVASCIYANQTRPGPGLPFPFASSQIAAVLHSHLLLISLPALGAVNSVTHLQSLVGLLLLPCFPRLVAFAFVCFVLCLAHSSFSTAGHRLLSVSPPPPRVLDRSCSWVPCVSVNTRQTPTHSSAARARPRM